MYYVTREADVYGNNTDKDILWIGEDLDVAIRQADFFCKDDDDILANGYFVMKFNHTKKSGGLWFEESDIAYRTNKRGS